MYENDMLMYGVEWQNAASPLEIEMEIIRAGGYMTLQGKQYGNGPFFHYRQLQTLLWPEGEDHHRWSDLMLQHYLNERITIVQGPKDVSKTHTWGRLALTDYFVFPDITLWLISSTDLRGLELRIWGDLKDMFNRAKEKHPWLPGYALESKHGIFTNRIDEEEIRARDLRSALICIPCIGGNGEWSGIEKYCGIKQKRRRLLGDELQLMRQPYLKSIEHLDKGDFKMMGSGNPIGIGDPLDKLAEPSTGWGTEPQTTKTEVWRNKWGGITISIDGRDNLNNDPPKNRYPYILNDSDIARTEGRHGKDSAVCWTQVYGKRKPGLNQYRVLTRELCLSKGAFDDCVWQGEELTEVYALDSAFGGDRAVQGSITFGHAVGGRILLRVNQPEIIPVVVNSPTHETDEEQLVFAARGYCEKRNIPAERVFLDAGMRATLINTFSRLWSPAINAVNFGGKATQRPVSSDEFIMDQKTQQRRLKRCDEQYSRFVTELWFAVRLCVISQQLKNLPEEVAEEFYQREWHWVTGDRYELETKKEMKERIGFSPDYADWLAIGCEGARRLGFMIENLPDENVEQQSDPNYLEIELQKHRRERKRRELSYST